MNMSATGEDALEMAHTEAKDPSLRAPLASLRDGDVSGTAHGGIPDESEINVHPDGKPDVVPRKKYDALIAQYQRLSKHYLTMKDDRDQERKRADSWHRKYCDAKTNIREWRAYLDHHKAKRAKVQIDGSARPANAVDDDLTAQTSSPSTAMDRDATPRPVQVLSKGDGAHEVSRIAYHGQNLLSMALLSTTSHSASGVPSSPRAARITSSQTTDPGSEPLGANSSPLAKLQPSSDDEPVVMSTRSLKRKRSDCPPAEPVRVRIKQEPNSPQRPIEIKSEEFSSPVLSRTGVIRNETMDLDVPVASMSASARRRRVHGHIEQRAISEEIARPPRLSKSFSSLSDSGLPELEAQMPPTDLHHRDGDRSLESIVQAQVTPLAPINTRSAGQVLRPLSINVPSPRRPKARSASTKRKQSNESAAAKAAMLSEDGESQLLEPHRQRAPGNAQNQQGRARLDDMLDVPVAGLQPLVRDHAPRPAPPRARQPLAPAFAPSPPRNASRATISPEKRITPKAAERESIQGTTTSTSKKDIARLKRPLDIEKSAPTPPPFQGPFRFRPLASLRLEDFKINPKYAGSDFAFSEAVRSKDQRRCLQGCTNPDCCGGAFLKAIEMGGDHDQASDAEVLEAYLGPNWQHMMGMYPKDRRDDLLKQARAADMANRHGKHRHAFQRHSTPPGFWRTDMPSTQEEAEDRAKAKEMVRRKVEERWREAMRDGGRWLFRDEYDA